MGRGVKFKNVFSRGGGERVLSIFFTSLLKGGAWEFKLLCVVTATRTRK
jgi:hypothetical protein